MPKTLWVALLVVFLLATIFHLSNRYDRAEWEEYYRQEEGTVNGFKAEMLRWK